MVRKILFTELTIIALVWLYFYPLISIPYVGVLLQKILRWILLFFVLLYIPWYWWSRVFFKDNELTIFERFTTSFALSLWFTVFASLYLSIAWVTVNTWHGVVASCIAIATWILIVVIQQFIRRQSATS